MKKLFTVLIFIGMFGLLGIPYKVEAITSKEVNYQEPQGTMLTINITGESKEGQLLLSPEYMQFRLTAGEVINKNELLDKVQLVIDSAASNQFEVVDFKPESKVEWSYFDRHELLDITERGFIVPDYSIYEKKPSFLLTGPVIIQRKSPTTEKQTIDSNTDVILRHSVSFMKKNGESMNLVPTTTQLSSFSRTAKPGQSIQSEELYQVAQSLFKQTKEYHEGYRLIKRLNTSISENEKAYRSVYQFQNGKPFNYRISQLREFSKWDYSKAIRDDIIENYYISKNGDDYYPEQIKITLDLTNEEETSIRTLTLDLPKENTIEHIKHYLSEAGLTEIDAKTGDHYWFSQNVKQVSSYHFQANYFSKENSDLFYYNRFSLQ